MAASQPFGMLHATCWDVGLRWRATDAVVFGPPVGLDLAGARRRGGTVRAAGEQLPGRDGCHLQALAVVYNGRGIALVAATRSAPADHPPTQDGGADPPREAMA